MVCLALSSCLSTCRELCRELLEGTLSNFVSFQLQLFMSSGFVFVAAEVFVMSLLLSSANDIVSKRTFFAHFSCILFLLNLSFCLYQSLSFPNLFNFSSFYLSCIFVSYKYHNYLPCLSVYLSSFPILDLVYLS